jgi:hypothetical protein
MRGLLLAAACIYAVKSHAPAVIRAYFDVLMAHAFLLYGAFHYFGDTSRVYMWVYIAVTVPLVMASFAVAALYCTLHERSTAVYLLCCAIGATAGYAIAQLATHKGYILACESGAFLAVGLLMAVSVGCCETPAEKLVAAVLAANWTCKALLDFAMVGFNFSPRLLEAGAVLPWSFFLASAIVVGYSFRKQFVGLGV